MIRGNQKKRGDQLSVHNGPGGLPRAPDETGPLSVVRPGRTKGRTAVFGQDGGPYRVRHFSSGRRAAGDNRGWSEMAGDGRGQVSKGRSRWGTTGDGRGQQE